MKKMKKTNLILGMLMIIIFSSCAKKTIDNNITLSSVQDIDVLKKALAWQESNPIANNAPTDWTHGAYYTGVARAHKNTNVPVFKEALQAMAIRNNWQTWNRMYHADDVVISYPYLYLKQIGETNVNLEPTDHFIKKHFEPSDWRDGKSSRPDQVQLWWWCDALFMAPPVLVKRSIMKNDPALLDSMHKYYMQCYDLLYDKEEKLFFRDNRFLIKGEPTDRIEANGKKIFWSRGNGWVIAGLALILEDMPKDYKYRSFYENLYKEMASKILEIQPESGLWHTSLLHPESYSYGEVSGTGFHTFAIAWGLNNGYLKDPKYKKAVVKAWDALKKCQQASGKVGWVQNIGAFPEPTAADSYQNFGTGAFLMAGSEVIKLK